MIHTLISFVNLDQENKLGNIACVLSYPLKLGSIQINIITCRISFFKKPPIFLIPRGGKLQRTFTNSSFPNTWDYNPPRYPPSKVVAIYFKPIQRTAINPFIYLRKSSLFHKKHGAHYDVIKILAVSAHSKYCNINPKLLHNKNKCK